MNHFSGRLGQVLLILIWRRQWLLTSALGNSGAAGPQGDDQSTFYFSLSLQFTRLPWWLSLTAKSQPAEKFQIGPSRAFPIFVRSVLSFPLLCPPYLGVRLVLVPLRSSPFFSGPLFHFILVPNSGTADEVTRPSPLAGSNSRVGAGKQKQYSH